MPETKQFQPVPPLCLFGTVLAGAACTKWIPSDWFLSVLGYSILVALILAFLATLDLKNERRPSIPVALMLEVLWLPSRNAEVKFGLILWAFMGVAGFVTGILVSAILLPLFT
jgi:hypothetical protein